MKGVATPERLKELIDIANEIVKEKKAEFIDLSERAAGLDRIIGRAVEEIIAEWAKPDYEKGTDNK